MYINEFIKPNPSPYFTMLWSSTGINKEKSRNVGNVPSMCSLYLLGVTDEDKLGKTIGK